MRRAGRHGLLDALRLLLRLACLLASRCSLWLRFWARLLLGGLRPWLLFGLRGFVGHFDDNAAREADESCAGLGWWQWCGRPNGILRTVRSETAFTLRGDVLKRTLGIGLRLRHRDRLRRLHHRALRHGLGLAHAKFFKPHLGFAIAACLLCVRLLHVRPHLAQHGQDEREQNDDDVEVLLNEVENLRQHVWWMVGVGGCRC